MQPHICKLPFKLRHHHHFNIFDTPPPHQPPSPFLPFNSFVNDVRRLLVETCPGNRWPASSTATARHCQQRRDTVNAGPAPMLQGKRHRECSSDDEMR